ncbi:hypothetical protein PTSG_09417 [Salpingoeca rosetta]|uniref:DNA polymerase n=1 Tax=Salpingoeca rosetta (strain ATCC 50818 / BSB-021) TaxID=946362 RepID=F2UMK2_SALR5|nr:uncharacterized protein PTSG_09417 [Salpingoeca rosetta]EGD78351.1 hypothetical protein PTSG_09417 [Salpingoeca rosetta]|eukprot:XP_004989674.1 hypothetical protein PTSG_09417 [Salpingoeca rosetta]
MAEETANMDALDMAEKGLLNLDELDEGRTRSSRRDKLKQKRDATRAAFKMDRNALLDDGDDDLYDEVDDDAYEQHRRQQLQHADFIVDDGDGDYGGYYDDGRDIMEDDDEVFNAQYSNAARKARRGPRGPTGPRKKKAPKKASRAANLFSSGKGARLGAAVVKMSHATRPLGEDKLLAEVMGETGMDGDGEDDDVLQMLKARRNAKKNKSLAHIALHGSVDAAHDVFMKGELPHDDEDDDNDDGADTKKRSKRSAAAKTTPAAAGGKPAPKSLEAMGEPPLDIDDMNDNNDDDDDDDGVGGGGGMDAEPMESPEGRASTQEWSSATTPSPSKKNSSAGAAKQPALAVVDINMDEDGDDDDDDDDGDDDVMQDQAANSTKPKSKGGDYLKVSKPMEIEEEATKPAWSSTPVDTHKDVKLDLKAPPLDDYEGEQVLHFYWLDAYELPFDNKSGAVYLFGKVFVESVSEYVSCCVTVRGLERNLFVLPREFKVDAQGNDTTEKVEMGDVFEEVDTLLSRRGISTRLAKPVERNYAFEEKGVPANAEFLKIKYPARLGSSLVAHMHNNVHTTTHTRAPSHAPAHTHARVPAHTLPVAHTRVEIDDPKLVSKVQDPPEAPPLTVLSLSMQTRHDRKTHQNEILSLVGLVCSNVQLDGKTENIDKNLSHFSLIRKLQDQPFPFDFEPTIMQKKRGTKRFPNERALLSFFLTRVFNTDPDVIVGHNLFGMGLDVLMHRLKQHNIPQWSRIGRLKRKRMPNLQAGLGHRKNLAATRDALSGRLLLDVQHSSRELIRQVSYGLTDLVHNQLGMKRTEIEQEQIPRMYGNTADLIQLVDHTERDAYYSLQLMFKLQILPLMKQITNITGGLMSRTLTRGRSDRNEFLLCHEFHRRKYIVPDVPERNSGKNKKDSDDGGDGKESASSRRKPKYAGGLVLEPKRGFYDNYILLLDFNSLYPSIIQEYNLCFTTVKRDHLSDDMEDSFAEIPDETADKGILPRILKTLIAKRKQVKALIKAETNPARLAEYDIRQKALKLTANSMYGCLGFVGSRFYAKPIAELITTKGREILQNTVDLAQNKMNLDVIYGDTDSIMINTRSRDYKETRQIGHRVKKEVNALYRELEIDIDGVYKTMLLLKKKKYAALTIVENKDGTFRTERETKGLDIVRRDWCGLAHRIGNIILNKILTQEQGQRDKLVEECHEELHKVGESAREGTIPLEEYIIHKSLTKDPNQYPDAKNQPHVQVALRMRANGKSIKQHDTIPYIICNDGSELPATQRAYHPDDVRKKDNLQVDVDYYLKSQVHPVVSRMLEPIEGTDNAQVAECLGLDASSFRRQYEATDLDDDMSFSLSTQLTDEERFKTASPLTVVCRQCNHESTFAGVFRLSEQGDVRLGLQCANAGCTAMYPVNYLKNRVSLEARKAIHEYYTCKLVCSEPECPRHTQGTHQLSVNGARCLEKRCQGTMRKLYSERMLYTQLSFFAHLFNVPHAVQQLPEELQRIGQQTADQYRSQYQDAFVHAEALLNKSARRFVHLGQLFGAIKLSF